MRAALLSALAVLTAAPSAGCAGGPGPALDADGCVPAQSIYSPPVRLGGAPSMINIPRRCPARSEAPKPPEVTVASEIERQLAAVTGGQAPGPAPEAGATPPPRRVPPALPNAAAALTNGVDRLCNWFLAGQGYSFEAAVNTAYDAGYQRGSPAQILPTAAMASQPSYSALGYTAVVSSETTHGVTAFLTFHNPMCQVQAYGYDDEATAWIAGLPAQGWRPQGEARVVGELRIRRYFGGAAGAPRTLIVHQLTQPGDTPGRLSLIVNVLGGEQSEGGEVQ